MCCHTGGYKTDARIGVDDLGLPNSHNGIQVKSKATRQSTHAHGITTHSKIRNSTENTEMMTPQQMQQKSYAFSAIGRTTNTLCECESKSNTENEKGTRNTSGAHCKHTFVDSISLIQFRKNTAYMQLNAQFCV